MIKRVSLVWKKAGLTNAVFREIWLGEHAAYARRLPGLREYVIDFAQDAPAGAPAGIATVRFDDRKALDDAFAIPDLKENLLRTRGDFAGEIKVMIVDEHVVVRQEKGANE